MRVKYKIKKFFKSIPNGVYTIILCLSILAIGLGFGFYFKGKQNDYNVMLKEHFIEATTSTELTNKFLNQKEEKYFVLGFYGNDADYTIIEEFEKISKEENIGWYAIDLSKYQGLLGSNNIDVSKGHVYTWLSALNGTAQYWLVTSNYETDSETGEKVCVDKTFKLYQTGYYNSEQLTKEINWVMENGAPLNEIGTTKTINNMTFLWGSVNKTTNPENSNCIRVEIEAALLNTQNGNELDPFLFKLKSGDYLFEFLNCYVEADGELKSIDTVELSTSSNKKIVLEFKYNSQKYDVNNLTLTYEKGTEKVSWKIFRPSL